MITTSIKNATILLKICDIFTMLPNSKTQYLTSIGLFCKNWENCGGCLTVKISGGLLTGDDGTDPTKSISV